MLHTKTIKELAKGLANKEFSSVELTKHFLARIKKFDKELNSFITITEEKALAEAAKADQKLKTQGQSLLTGIPIAHKDIFCTESIKTSCGSKMLDNFISPYDATIVAKLKAQNVVTLGKTNMDEFAMGSSNETSFYGPVKNPWNTTCVPGGSSGGSAASLAARLAPIATGTDTGGSIRQPAAFTNVTGIKPTYGRVSRYGMIAFASSLDQAGPMAGSAEDCAILLAAMAGFDEKDSTSIDVAVPDYLTTINDSLKGLKIGLPKEFFDNKLNSNVKTVIENSAKELEKQGAQLIEISLPNSELAIPSYYVIAPAEASSNLARYDGVRYGYSCEQPKNLEDLYKRSRSEGFGLEVKRRILIGTYVLSAGYYDAYYIRAQQIRRMIANDFANAFKTVDVILGPTAPGVAFNIGSKSKDPVSMYLNDIYTSSVNLAGLPAISFPAGFIDNMPIGTQIIGNNFQEAKLLNIAHKYQQITNWHKELPQMIR